MHPRGALPVDAANGWHSAGVVSPLIDGRRAGAGGGGEPHPARRFVLLARCRPSQEQFRTREQGGGGGIERAQHSFKEPLRFAGSTLTSDASGVAAPGSPAIFTARDGALEPRLPTIQHPDVAPRWLPSAAAVSPWDPRPGRASASQNCHREARAFRRREERWRRACQRSVVSCVVAPLEN